MRRLILVASAVLIFGATAMAVDMWPAPWQEDPTDPHWVDGKTTEQRWEFPTDPENPVYVDNPFGDPVVEVVNGTYPDWVQGWEGGEIATWHVGPGEGKLRITVPNNPEPNKQKVIWVQVTSDKGPAPGGPVTNPPGTVSYPKPAVGLGGTWYVYTAQVVIPYNPPYEVIEYTFPECTNIEEVVVKTICVPEPATLGLLALGGLALIRRRR